MNPELTSNQTPAFVRVTLPAKRRYLPNLFGWLFGLFVLLTT